MKNLKSSGMDKQVSLQEAAQLVQDGDVLALGGMTLYRRPMAFVQELLRREMPPRDLTLLSFTASIESDLLVGAGLVRCVRSCYFGLEAFGLAPMFTKMAGEGKIQVLEETEASLSFGLRAAMAGVSFMPGQGWIGTDLPRVRPDVKLIDNPYGPGQYAAFPAIHCDVAVIHALRVDVTGNAEVGRNKAVDGDLPFVARRVVITAEEVVERLAGPIDVACLSVDAVVHAPHGAWPTSCHPHYPLDGQELMRYTESCPDDFEAYLVSLLQSSHPF